VIRYSEGEEERRKGKKRMEGYVLSEPQKKKCGGDLLRSNAKILKIKRVGKKDKMGETSPKH